MPGKCSLVNAMNPLPLSTEKPPCRSYGVAGRFVLLMTPSSPLSALYGRRSRCREPGNPMSCRRRPRQPRRGGGHWRGSFTPPFAHWIADPSRRRGVCGGGRESRRHWNFHTHSLGRPNSIGISKQQTALVLRVACRNRGGLVSQVL